MAGHLKIDVNGASARDLEQIPGVDHGLAEAIVGLREKRGWIHNLEELTDVGPIDPEEMERLRRWLTVASARSGSLEYEGQKEEPDSL